MLFLPRRFFAWFGQIWSRLPTTQRQSLVSLLILLIALPGGIYLTDKTQIFNPRGQEQPEVQTEPPKTYGYIVELKKDPVVKYKKGQEEAGRGFIAVDYQSELEREHQDAKADLLSRLGKGGVSVQEVDSTLKVTNEFTTVFNGFALDIDQEQADKIKGSPLVKEVYPNYEVKTLLNDSVPLINTDKVWELKDSQGRDVTGQGVRVAVIDTGVDYTHPDLGATQITDRNFTKVGTIIGSTYLPYDIAQEQVISLDNNRLAYPGAGSFIILYRLDGKQPLFDIVYLFPGGGDLQARRLVLKDNILVYYAVNKQGKGALYFNELNTRKSTKITDIGVIGSVSISNGKVIYAGTIYENTDKVGIYVYDIASGTQTTLEEGNPISSFTRSSGKFVVYPQINISLGCRYSDKTVLYDTNTNERREITLPNMGGIVDFRENKILYIACRDEAGYISDNAYYLYDIQTGESTRLSYQPGNIDQEGINVQSITPNYFYTLLLSLSQHGSIQDEIVFFDKNAREHKIVGYDLNLQRYVQINLWRNAYAFVAEGNKVCFLSEGANVYCHDYDSQDSYPNHKFSVFNKKVVSGYDFIDNDNDPYETIGHGTHVSSVLAGNGVLNGVAPDAEIVALKVIGPTGSGSGSKVISALEYSVQTVIDDDPSNDVGIINISLGTDCGLLYNDFCGPDDPMSQAVDNSVDAGLIVVVSAGNAGPGGQTIGSPGTARKAITVGAVEKSKQIASFSSRGPVVLRDGSGRIIERINKPDIVAPGVNICAAEWEEWLSNRKCVDDRHISLQGTSMAAPHVAGVAALLKQIHPDWTPQQIKDALMNTAVDLGYDANTQGTGLVDALASIGQLFSATISGSSSMRLGQTVSFRADARGQDIAWTRIYWAKADSDLTRAESWTLVGSSECAEGSASCAVTGNFTGNSGGEYWLTAVANDRKLGPCSGNPEWASVPGWKDCGPSSRLKVSVLNVACIQVITPAKNDQTGECKEFPTPCDVPEGWTKVASCEATPSPTPTSSSPTGTISGPTSGKVGQNLTYTGRGNGPDPQTVSMHWAKADSDLTRGEFWHFIAKNELACFSYTASGLDCTAEGIFAPTEAGTYYVSIVVVDNKDGPCSGNPKWDSVPGWKDCGPKDAILLTVSP